MQIQALWIFVCLGSVQLSICRAADPSSEKAPVPLSCTSPPPPPPPGHCIGSAATSWMICDTPGDYQVPMGTVLTIAPKPGGSNAYELQFKDTNGNNPLSQLQPIALTPILRKPPQEISGTALDTFFNTWENDYPTDYLRSAYDLLHSPYNFTMGFAAVGSPAVPTLVVFMQSAYSGNKGECRKFALVLKKMDEVMPLHVKRSKAINYKRQGGVIHGQEN